MAPFRQLAGPLQISKNISWGSARAFFWVKTMKESYKILGIHSQSNRPDAPLDFEGDPAEQAFDSRVLCLPDLEATVLSRPVEYAYANYNHRILRQKLPRVIVPQDSGKSLSKSLLGDPAAIAEIAALQKLSGSPYILSVFDPTKSEEELFGHLKKNQLDVLPEVDFALAETLGNKACFREFCQTHGIPQLPGGVFTRESDLKEFLDKSRKEKLGVIIKHPYGTAGEGSAVIDPSVEPSNGQLTQWSRWMQKSGCVVAEIFSPSGGEHALHIYISPVNYQAKITGIYDQLVYEMEDGALAHYGCKYPSQTPGLEKCLSRLAVESIIPALSEAGYTGPACFDLLSSPLHFMELNARAGANMYAHRMVEKVSREVYGITDFKSVAFMFLASLKHEAPNFSVFLERNLDALKPQETGMVILTNPGRHAFGSYDIIGMSPFGLNQAEGVLFKSLEKIWGAQAARNFFDNIHQRSK